MKTDWSVMSCDLDRSGFTIWVRLLSAECPTLEMSKCLQRHFITDFTVLGYRYHQIKTTSVISWILDPRLQFFMYNRHRRTENYGRTISFTKITDLCSGKSSWNLTTNQVLIGIHFEDFIIDLHLYLTSGIKLA